MNKNKLLLPLVALLLASCSININPSSNGSNPSNNEDSNVVDNTSDKTSEDSTNKETSNSTSDKPASNTTSEKPTSNATSEKPTSNVPVSSPISEIIEPFTSKAKNISHYLKEGQDVPKISITGLANQNYMWDKENYTTGSLTITDQVTNETILPSASMGIRLRGNSTSQGAKKPFRIKFDSKVSLFGLPKAKSWVLLANYFDKANIRNYLAYLTANKLEYLTKDRFQPSSIFVDLYLNNEYQGLYLLCEQMQTGTGRVDIESKVGADGTQSYFIEQEFAERLEGTRDVDYFSVYSTNYQVKWPEVEDQTLMRQYTAYIKDFVQKAYDANKGQTNWKDYIDYKSFIDGYLLQELFKNVDVASGSNYFVITPGQPMYLGPVWDFDIGLDAVGSTNRYHDYDAYQNAELWANGNKWYQHLLEIPEVQTYTKQRYKEIKPILQEVYSEIDTLKPLLKNAQDRNQKKWPIPGQTGDWISQRFATNYSRLTTYEQHYQYVIDKLNERFAVLDKYYGN